MDHEAEQARSTTRRRSTWRVAEAALLVAASVGAALVTGAGAPASAAAEPTEVALDGPVVVLDAATVPGDAIYLARGGTVVRIVPGSAPQTIAIPAPATARALAVAPDGTLWFGGTGSVGTIAPDGTVTTKALAEPDRTVTSLAIDDSGSLWALTGWTGWAHLERGAPGGSMTAVTLPPAPGGNYTEVVAGGSGAVLTLGPTNASVSADGTFTPLSGFPAGTINDVERIGSDVWAATTGGLVEIDTSDSVTTYGLGQVPGGIPDAVSAGPDGGVWYSASGNDGSASNLGHVGPTGPDHATVLAATPAHASDFIATELTPDPSTDRLWAGGGRGADIRAVPVALSPTLSTITVDDPGPQSFGVSTTATAHVAPWATGSNPTGTVTFTSSGVVLGTAAVQPDGSATTSIQPPFQSLDLRATYSGDVAHRVAWSGTAHRSVATSPTEVTITSPPKPWRPGTLTFRVRVTSPTGAVPTGTVTMGGTSAPIAGGQEVAISLTTYPGSQAFSAAFAPADGYGASDATVPTTVVSWDTDEENYVTGAYLRLFGRLPDPSGRRYWVGRLHAGLSRDRFALAQVATNEYRRTVAKRVGLVPGGATVAQAQPAVDAMATTTVRDLLVAHWAAASRVTSCVDTTGPTLPPGTFMCWAKVIYLTYAGHATQADYAHALALGNTPGGRKLLATELIYGDHAVNEVVARAYGAYLDRAPDPGGLSYWTHKIQGGMREEGVEARVLGSNEFWRKSHLPPADR